MRRPLTELEYCSTVCKASCCRMNLSGQGEGVVDCPNLTEGRTCSVYATRYAPEAPRVVVIGSFRSKAFKDMEGEYALRPFFCGHVEDLHAQGRLPEMTAQQCCVLHPELLLGE